MLSRHGTSTAVSALAESAARKRQEHPLGSVFLTEVPAENYRPGIRVRGENASMPNVTGRCDWPGEKFPEGASHPRLLDRQDSEGSRVARHHWGA